MCFRLGDGEWKPTGLSVKLQSAVTSVEINLDGKTQQAILRKETGNAITFTGDDQVCVYIYAHMVRICVERASASPTVCVKVACSVDRHAVRKCTVAAYMRHARAQTRNAHTLLRDAA